MTLPRAARNPWSGVIDAWALALVDDPNALTGQRDTDAPIAQATAMSRAAFGSHHSKRTANALIPMVQTAQLRDPRALSARQLHTLIGLAAADLLEADHLAQYLTAFQDPGVDICYQPISITELHHALHRVLEAFPSAKRAELLTHYATHPHPGVRWALAHNPNLDADAQRQLATDPHQYVREGLAENPNLVPDLQRQLATDPDPYVRGTLARNPNLDADTQRQLATDPDPYVRKRLAENPNLLAELQPQPAASLRVADVTDPHERYAAALGDGPPEDRAVVAPAITRIAIAQRALESGAVVKARDVKDAATLPSLDDVTYPSAHAAQECFGAATNLPVEVSVLENGRAQRTNGIEMANCTQNDHYISACQAGTTIVTRFEHDNTLYNIAWKHNDTRWTRHEVNSAGNQGVTDKVRTIADQLTACLDGLAPGTPIAFHPDTAIAALSIDLTADRTPHTRQHARNR